MSPPLRKGLLALCALLFLACTATSVFAQDSSSSAELVLDSSSTGAFGLDSSAEVAVDSSSSAEAAVDSSSATEVPVDSSSSNEVVAGSSSASQEDPSSSAMDTAATTGDASSAEDMTSTADASSAAEMMSTADGSSAEDMTSTADASTGAAEMDSSSAMNTDSTADASSAAMVDDSSSALDMMSSADAESTGTDASSATNNDQSSTADMMESSSSAMDMMSTAAEMGSSSADASMDSGSSAMDSDVSSTGAEADMSSSADAASAATASDFSSIEATGADSSSATDSDSSAEMVSSASDMDSTADASTAADSGSTGADASSAMDNESSAEMMSTAVDGSSADAASAATADDMSSTADAVTADASSAEDMTSTADASTGSAEMDSSSAIDTAATTADASSAEEMTSTADASSAADMTSTADASTGSAEMDSSSAIDTAATTGDASSAEDMTSTADASSAAEMMSTADGSSAEDMTSTADASTGAPEMDSSSAMDSTAMMANSSTAEAIVDSSSAAFVDVSSTGAVVPESSTGAAAVTSTYFARADMFSGSLEASPLLNLTVLFSQSAPGEDVTITVTINNLPAGTYGFHIHVYGDVTTKNPINTAITGGHFNPLGSAHGCWPSNERHVGDIGNLTSTGVNGQQVVFVRNLIELSSNNQSIIGRSVILHKFPDTCGQPTGAAGTYWAEGVIGIAAPPAPFTTNLAASAGVSTPFTGEALMVPVPFAFPIVASGMVSFAELPSGLVRIVASFSGLPASTTLAMHVHVWGDVSGFDGGATGGHYNPTNVPHALFPAVPRHMGDIGNVIVTDASGNAFVDVERDLLTLTNSTGNIIGRSVVVHSGQDNGVTQPTGASGNKLLVGVIGVSGRVQPPRVSSSSTGGAVAPSSTAVPAAQSSTADNGNATASSSTGVAPIPASDAIKVTVFFTSPIEYFTQTVLTDLRAAIAASMGITDLNRIEITVVAAAPTAAVHTLQAMLLPMRMRKVAGTQLSFLVLPGAAGDAVTPSAAVASFTAAFQNATSPLRTAPAFATVDATIAPSTAPVSPCADGSFTTPCPSGGNPDSEGTDDKKTGVIIGVIVGVSLALVIILLVSKRFLCPPQRFKEFSGVELQYDESVRAGAAPAGQPVNLTPNPASGRVHQGQELTFEAVSDEPLPDRFPHRASIV